MPDRDASVPNPLLPDRVAAALVAVPSRVSLLCEADGTVVWASGTATTLLALAPADLVGGRIAVEPPPAGRPTFVLGGDGRSRRITVRVVDLRDHPDVGALLVEWELAPSPVDEAVGGLPAIDAVRAAVEQLGGATERGIGVLRLRADRPLPPGAVAVLEERLRHALRASDVPGRLPDGDIVVVCPGHWTPASAAATAQRLRSHVNGPVRADDGIVALRLDAGVATGSTREFDELLRRAALALPARPAPVTAPAPADASAPAIS